MSVIDRITKDLTSAKTLPLEGIRLGICLHITKETSVLIMALKTLGAEMALCSANPLSIQNDIASFLKDQDVMVYATRDESYKQYQDNMMEVLRFKQQIVTDFGIIVL